METAACSHVLAPETSENVEISPKPTDLHSPNLKLTNLGYCSRLLLTVTVHGYCSRLLFPVAWLIP